MVKKYISCKSCPYCVKKPFNRLHCLIYAMDVKKLGGCPMTDWGDGFEDIYWREGFDDAYEDDKDSTP